MSRVLLKECRWEGAMADELNDGGRSAAVHSGLAAQRMISSRDILGDNKSIFICHEGDVYRLQQTAAGKLILTK
jgi:hemin uptake protein HemP